MTKLQLSEIKSPAELQGCDIGELQDLATQIRSALVEKVLTTGGHLGSNLGVVEITIALHKVFEFRRDRLVFDVGHQSYPHKMLTGRYGDFHGLRQTNGMSGFCNRFESPYDLLTAGHAGTSISFAMGLAEGMRGSAGPGEEDPWAVSLIGDAAIASGVAFEGINHAGDRKPRLLVVLNDNEWSIAKSVGAMARYLSRVRTSRTIHGAVERLSSLAHSIPWLGERMEDMGEVLRHVMVPGHVFEELGVNYVGPLDGHDIAGCINAFERIKLLDGVHLVHLLTEKGRGYEPASSDSERAHGVKASLKVPRPKPKDEIKRSAFTSVFSDAMLALGERDSRLQAITAGMPGGTGLVAFMERFPERAFDTGITEQHAVALAGGLATAGKRPVVTIYSTFLQRGYDQVFQEVALQEENVIFAMDRGGLVGQDGPTHHGLFDMAYLRALPGITLASPRDAVEVERMLSAGLEHGGPWALRWPRGEAHDCLGAPAELRPELLPGTAEQMRAGNKGVVFALGAMVENAMLAAAELAADGIELEVWDARFCRPLDRGALALASRRHSRMATVEEHALNGGFGSAVAEAVADLGLTIGLQRFGVPDRFIAHATTREEQLEECGLSVSALVSSWREYFGSGTVDKLSSAVREDYA